MHGEPGDACGGAELDQAEQALLRRLVVDADAALDRGGNRHGRGDRGHALGHQLRLTHQAGAETAALHPVGGATDIEVDLVIAKIGADARRLGQVLGLRSAELQGDRMLARIETQQALAVAMQHRARGHHLGIDQGPPAQRAVKRPAVPVGPVHKRRHRESVRLKLLHFYKLNRLDRGEAYDFTLQYDVFRSAPTGQRARNAH